MFFPLRTTETSRRFPRASLALVIFWCAAEFLSRAWPGPHLDFLKKIAFWPQHSGWNFVSALCFFPNFFSFVIAILFAWVFTPKVFERRGVLLSMVIALSGAALAIFSFRAIHPEAEAPLLAPEAFLGVLLGIFMRRDIWGSVSTLVLGLRWAQIFEVPSYVLLFFWFFYIFLANLFLVEPFASAPMLYWLPFVSFLWGFVIESILPAPKMQETDENRDSPT